MVLKDSGSSSAKELRKMSNNSTVGEIWLAYLHLINAKHRVKNAELFSVLDSASRAALEALREAEVLRSQSPSAA
jgi:hypothetical protein